MGLPLPYLHPYNTILMMLCDEYSVKQFLWLTRDYVLQAGYTALHLAASRGHLEVVRALLVASRSVNNQDKIVRVFHILFWKCEFNLLSNWQCQNSERVAFKAFEKLLNQIKIRMCSGGWITWGRWVGIDKFLSVFLNDSELFASKTSTGRLSHRVGAAMENNCIQQWNSA